MLKKDARKDASVSAPANLVNRARSVRSTRATAPLASESGRQDFDSTEGGLGRHQTMAGGAGTNLSVEARLEAKLENWPILMLSNMQAGTLVTSKGQTKDDNRDIPMPGQGFQVESRQGHSAFGLQQSTAAGQGFSSALELCKPYQPMSLEASPSLSSATCSQINSASPDADYRKPLMHRSELPTTLQV
jgi:hypothetical protein